MDSTEFLGMTLEFKLQKGPHIGALTSKLVSAAFAVKKIRQLTNVDTARFSIL